MPIHKVPGGWKWGQHGKTYQDRADAERQARAAYANGYRESKPQKQPEKLGDHFK